MKINSASHSVGISRQIFQTALLFVCLFLEVDNRNRRRRFEFGSEIRTCPLPPPPSLLPKVSVAWWRPKNIQIIIFEQNRYFFLFLTRVTDDILPASTWNLEINGGRGTRCVKQIIRPSSLLPPYRF